MRKTLLLGMTCLAAAGAFAQSAVEPLILEEFYAQKISPDGKWIYSKTAGAEVVIYNIETDDYNVFNEISLGNGNAISLNGTCVGQTDTGNALIIKGKLSTIPEPLRNYWYADINGITADASRIVGVVANSSSGGSSDEENQMYLPFVADLDANGQCGDLTFLPHPTKDFMGMVPQYCSATWISDDGKTILGQLVDYSGMSIQPIVYRQDQAGEWNYSLPTEKLFNPDHIEVPPYPGEFDYGAQPSLTDYMTPEKKEEYDEDMEYWYTHYLEDPDLAYPDDHLEDYMNEEQYEAYEEAINAYNDYVNEYNEKITEFIEARNAVFDTSLAFVQNASALNAEGTIASLTTMHYVETGGYMPESRYGAYMLDIVSGEITKIDTKYKDLIAGQVLDGGMFLSSTPKSECPATYVYEQGASDFVPVQDYLAEINPGAVAWMEENLVHELANGSDPGIEPYAVADGKAYGENMGMITGLGVASRDFSVFAGGVPAYMFDPVLYYMTYVFNGLTTGVKTVAKVDGSAVKVLGNGMLAFDGEVTDLCVIDLSGRKVFAMQNVEGIVDTNLAGGIYVVTYTDADGNRVSAKCKM